MSAIVRAGDQVASRYDLIELLVETPAGWWFRALDREVEVEVGLLAVRAELLPDQDSRDQLMGAAVAMRGVGHRHLLKLFDAGPIESRPGSGLNSGSVYVTAQLSRPAAPPATPAAVVAYAGVVAEALDALHRAGQVHGRLVPGDIVEASGLVKVMGAGLHDIIRPALALPWWGQQTRFWAPEVVRGQRATPAADVFSLAAISAELLAGQAGDVAGAMSALAGRARALHDVLQSSLSPVLDDRPASPGVLAGCLAAALDTDESESDSAPTMYFVKKSGDAGSSLVPGEGEPTEATPAPPVRLSSVRASTEAPAAGKPALQFVSMKPPSEQGARRTPVIPAIDKPEMKPKIRALTSPGAATARPGSLGRYAPPRDETRARRRTPTWVYMSVAALSSAALAVAVTLAIYGGVEAGGTAAYDAASVAVADASAPDARAARPTCAAGLLLVEQDDLVYCIEPYESPGKGEIPKVGITLAEAEAACQARGGRLCTRREWEHACRGDAGTAWPYGGEFEPGACNASTARRGALEPAGSRQRCRSPIGAHDMSGNAAEWVSGGEIRGGSARDLSDARCSRSEQREGPQRAYPDVGFRCCAEPARP